MRLLLTGACGLVGRAVRRAAGDAHTIVAMDIADAVDKLPGVSPVRASVTDRDAVLRAADGCDAIIHTAAMHGAYRDKATNQQFLEANLIGAQNLFDAAMEHGIRRLVFSSTLEVLCGYDYAASGITVYDEHTPPRPDWIYPLSKLLVEELGHYYARNHGRQVVQLRYAYVRDVPVNRVGFGYLARSIADSDVAQANLLSATTPGLTDHVFLICPDSPLTMTDIIEAQTDPWAVLDRHWPGCAAVLQRHKLHPRPDQFWPVARIDAAKQILGWRPRVTFDTFLRELGWRPASAVDQPVASRSTP